ncbi:hypothetical protein [Peribacillus asahii]|uniref:hypothetical protein n=1 Tax=Peribacillus asahii TaxID=228899 RepID=UPI0037FEBCBF
MPFPNIPPEGINPIDGLDPEQVALLLLANIAFEELGLAYLINTGAENLQGAIGTLVDENGVLLNPLIQAESLDDLLTVNREVEKMLRTIVKKEMLLQFKFENVLDLLATISPPPDCIQPMIALTISSGDNGCTFNISGTVTCSGQPVSSGMVTLTATMSSGSGTVTVSPNAAMITNGTFSATLAATNFTFGTAEVTATTAINGVTVSTTATTNVDCFISRCSSFRYGGSSLSKNQIYPPGWNSN